jgi:hypothetical protein
MSSKKLRKPKPLQGKAPLLPKRPAASRDGDRRRRGPDLARQAVALKEVTKAWNIDAIPIDPAAEPGDRGQS